jgi:regulator of protease activity HflC (stomatin/prohibitin superfamily)
VHLVSIKEQSLDLSGEKGGKLAMTDDGTVLRLDSILRYVPDEKNIDHFLFGMKAPLEHITALFTCLLRNKIANFRETAVRSDEAAVSIRSLGFAVDDSIGSYALIRRERRQLNKRIEEFCEREIGHRYGVKFQGVDLTDILPPDELSEALNAVMNAHSEAETQYFQAESACHHRVVAAREGIAISERRAQAVENEIKKLGEYLIELKRRGQLGAYVQRRRAEVLAESRTLYVKSSATGASLKSEVV